MKLTLNPATKADDTTFRNLYQFYLYEFSRFMGWPPNYAGRFDETDLDGCWTDAARHPFLIRVDDALAGLLIVDIGIESHYQPGLSVNYLTEFFIMGMYQGRGVGAQIAAQVFDLFPGVWEVTELLPNVNAIAFWRKVIGRYTAEQYQESTVEDGAVLLQTFDTTPLAEG